MFLLYSFISAFIAITIYFYIGPRLGLFNLIWRAKFILMKLIIKAEEKDVNKKRLIWLLIFCNKKEFGEILEELNLTEHDEIKKNFYKK